MSGLAERIDSSEVLLSDGLNGWNRWNDWNKSLRVTLKYIEASKLGLAANRRSEL